MQYGRPVLPNRWNLSDSDSIGLNFDTSAKRRIYPNLAGRPIIIPNGQSRIVANSGAGATPYFVTHGANCINVSPYDGACYVADDPPLGCSASPGYLNAGWLGMFCDGLITAGWDTQVAMSPIGVAGSSVTQWDTGGPYHDRIRAVSAMLTEFGNAGIWLWQQGTTDSIAGMSQATYAAALRSVIAYQRSLPGRSADKWMIAIDTIYGADVTSPGIRAAQIDVGNDANNFRGWDCDTLTYALGYSDSTHLTGTGNVQCAILARTAFMAAF